MSNKRISIIVPFYNVEQYIVQCLESVYNQDIPESEYEVICVDDCSPDNSIAIVERYAKLHSNLTIVRNRTNRRLGGARNAGMDVANGKFVWFVDSDDMVVNNCFAKLLSVAESNDLDMLHFNYVDYPDMVPYNRLEFETKIETGTEMFFDESFIWAHDLITVWRRIFKRQFLLENNIRFAEQVMFEDNDYSILTFAKTNRVKHIPNVVYLYRSNQASITRRRCTSEHIGYWMKLCHRLLALKQKLIEGKTDVRFDSVLKDFISYTVQNVIRQYTAMEGEQKEASKEIIYDEISASLKPYMPRRMYYKTRLHLL